MARHARLRAEGLPASPGYALYKWGGYLDFALPACHPSIDSRSHAYGALLLRDHAAVNALAPGWRDAAADGAGVAMRCRREKGPGP